MDVKRFVIGTAVGAITVSAIGFSLFALPPLRDFYLYAMNAGSATGVARVVELVPGAMAGGTVALVLNRLNTAGVSHPAAAA